MAMSAKQKRLAYQRRLEDARYDELWAFVKKCAGEGIERLYLPIYDLRLIGMRQQQPCYLEKGDTLTLTFTSGEKVMLVEDL
jgi:hypothetical protein